MYVAGEMMSKGVSVVEKLPAGKTRDIAELMDKAFSSDSLSNAKTSMDLVPVASVLMLYIMLRADQQNIFDNDPDYITAKHGMSAVTFGIFLLALDACTIRLYSDVFGNLSQKVGTVVTVAGYLILLWGIFSVRDEYHDMSPPAKAVSALGLLVVGCFVAVKLIQFTKWMNPSSVLPPMGFEKLESLLDESKVEEIRSVCAFAPMMMVAFFYLHFHRAQGTWPSDTEVYATYTAVVGVYLQGVAAVIRTSDSFFWEKASLILRGIALLPTYAAFVIVMFCGLRAGIESPAAQCLLLLLATVAILKLLILAMMEGSKYLLDNLDDDNLEWATNRVERLTALFKKMETSTGLAEILSIIFAYLHFRAKLVLNTDPATDLGDRGILVFMIYLATGSIFTQMVLNAVEFMVGDGESNKWITIGSAVCVGLANVGLFGCTISILS